MLSASQSKLKRAVRSLAIALIVTTTMWLLLSAAFMTAPFTSGQIPIWSWLTAGVVAVVGVAVSACEWFHFWSPSPKAARACAVSWAGVVVVCGTWGIGRIRDLWLPSSEAAQTFSRAGLVVIMRFAPLLVSLCMLTWAIHRWRAACRVSTPGHPAWLRAVVTRVLLVHAGMLGLFAVALTVHAGEALMLPEMFFGIDIEEHRMAVIERHYRHAPPAEFAAIAAVVEKEDVIDRAKPGIDTPPSSMQFLHASRMYVLPNRVSFVLGSCFDDDVTLSVHRLPDGHYAIYGHFGDFMRPEQLLWPK